MEIVRATEFVRREAAKALQGAPADYGAALEAIRKSPETDYNNCHFLDGVYLLQCDVRDLKTDKGLMTELQRETLQALTRERQGTMASEVGQLGLAINPFIGKYFDTSLWGKPLSHNPIEALKQHCQWASNRRSWHMYTVAHRMAQVGTREDKHRVDRAQDAGIRLNSWPHPTYRTPAEKVLDDVCPKLGGLDGEGRLYREAVEDLIALHADARPEQYTGPWGGWTYWDTHRSR